MSAEHANHSITSASDRRPAMWPWLLMPMAALALYVTLHSVRERAPLNGPVQNSPAQSTPADPADSADPGSEP